MFDFAEALRRLNLGAKLHRAEWKQFPVTRSCYLEYSNDGGRYESRVIVERQYDGPNGREDRIWKPLQSDLWATDWVDPAE